MIKECLGVHALVIEILITLITARNRVVDVRLGSRVQWRSAGSPEGVLEPVQSPPAAADGLDERLLDPGAQFPVGRSIIGEAGHGLLEPNSIMSASFQPSANRADPDRSGRRSGGSCPGDVFFARASSSSVKAHLEIEAKNEQFLGRRRGEDLVEEDLQGRVGHDVEAREAVRASRPR